MREGPAGCSCNCSSCWHEPVDDVHFVEIIESSDELGCVELGSLQRELAVGLQVVEELAAVDVVDHKIELCYARGSSSEYRVCRRRAQRRTFSGFWNENLRPTRNGLVFFSRM